MTGPAAVAGFLAVPGAVIAGIVGGAEPALGEDDIAAAIGRAAPSRAQQRRLAAALTSDPGLLTSGRPEGPPQIELLIRVLRENGARRLVLPRCAGCGQPRRLVQRDGSLRICSDCDIRRRGAAQPCAICGDTRKVATRDQDGRPRCGRCRPWDDPDPAARIAAHVSRLDPGLDHLRLAQVIGEAIPRPFQQHQVLWELDQRPGLLTGEGAHGSPRAVALIQALHAAGVSGVVAPACPSCGRTVPLSHRLGPARCCRRCYDQARLETCSRCQQPAQVASRSAAGEPVCSKCFRSDPANHDRCTTCGRTALAIRGEDGSLRCRRCYRPPLATCTLCGREKPCYLASSSTPRCENCSRQMRRASRALAAATGGPCGRAPPTAGLCAGRAAGSGCPAPGAAAPAPSRPGCPPGRCAARVTASTRPRSGPAPNAGPPNASTIMGCAPGARAASIFSACCRTIRAVCIRTPTRSTTCWPPAAPFP